MQTHATSASVATRRHRPKTLTVFAASFAAGVVLAYGVNRVVDVHVVQVEPQVESEPIFVALRSMSQGTPVTVWDVALKDWPKAMLPSTALRADAALEGVVLRHPIREGQPLLSGQLVRDAGPAPGTAFVAAPMTTPAAAASPPAAPVVAVPAVAEQFVPAMPAESATPAQADAVPASIPTAAAVPQDEPAADASADAATPTAAASPRSTDVDELPTIAVRPTPIAAAAAPEPPAPLPAAAPAPVPAPTPAATAVAVDVPLAAPVPTLPPTDIGRPLAAFTPKQEPRDARSESVLDRTTEATLPMATESNHKYHLVVPERIALAVDASFTQQPQPPVADERSPAVAGQTPVPLPAVAPNRTSARRQPAANPAASRKSAAQQRQQQQPAARPQAAPAGRGFSAWMPKFGGTSRQQ